jgi:hypothetical protein
LEAPFTDQEITDLIKALPASRSPGPDGFIGIFYKNCWEIIKVNLIKALQDFHNHKTSKLHLANEAHIVLLPKKEGYTEFSEFRPISLINSLAKIITKVLVDRLALMLDKLVSTSQNAFIKKAAFMTIFFTCKMLFIVSTRTKRQLFLLNWIYRKLLAL